jgi:hypothetical protein
MEMKRRQFVEILRGSLGGGALVLAGLATPWKRGVACFRAKAMQSRFYPGGLKRLRDTEISKPGKWAG